MNTTDIITRAIAAKAKPPRRREEKNLQTRILEDLHRRGIFAWRNNTGVAIFAGGRAAYGGSVSRTSRVAYGYPGSSDILAVLPPRGKLLAIECKSKTGRLTPAQVKFQAHIEAAGGWYVVATDFEIFTAWLDGALVLGER